MPPAEGTSSPIGAADFENFVKRIVDAVAEQVQVPALLDAVAARRYCGLSKSGWHRAKSAGLLPKSVYVEGSGDRWRKRDLDHWIERMRSRRK